MREIKDRSKNEKVNKNGVCDEASLIVKCHVYVGQLWWVRRCSGLCKFDDKFSGRLGKFCDHQPRAKLGGFGVQSL
ncbi:hypothetical protein R50076_12810 [Gilvimarinus japonicus]